MNLDLTRELEPAGENDDSDFKFVSPLPHWESNKPFRMSLNCHGVVHVKLQSAQRLPCPVGSSVCAVVSLLPWRGRVKTSRTSAFLSSLDHGVCVRWGGDGEAGLCSMVNAWSSDDSPVPSIKISLLFSPLGMGLLEFTMCSLTLPCEVLMESPGIWKEQWCQAAIDDTHEGQVSNLENERIPLIKISAMFAKSSDGLRPSLSTNLSRSNAPRTKEATSNSPQQLSKPLQSENINASKPHLLQVMSFWMPTTCCVCSNVMIGRNQGFQCEECSIQCCGDCRLHIDLQLPCGSEAATAAAESSIDSKITLSKILSVVAPDDAFIESRRNDIASHERKVGQHLTTSDELVTDDHKDGIGRLELKFIQACVFERRVSADTSPSDVFENQKYAVRHGDYYVRVSSTDSAKTSRTHTLQSTGVPKFNSKMDLSVSHYGVEFRVDVIDASTDETIGTHLLTTQRLLQDQRDSAVETNGASLLQCFKGPQKLTSKQRKKLELRTSVKTGYGPDFFPPPRGRGVDNTDDRDIEDAGAIAGWLEVDVGLEEWFDKLYGWNPQECPIRPNLDLNMTNFQIHIARVKSLIEDAKYAFAQYKYLVSWQNPGLTVSSLLLYVSFCLYFDSEYCGSLPFLFFLLLSLHYSVRRKRGGSKDYYIRKEIESCRKIGSSQEISVNYTLHRPVSILTISANKGRNLLSKDFGIPGKTSCHAVWDPMRCGDERCREKISMVDKSSDSMHAIGQTEAVYSSEPEWELFFASDESRRLKQIIPDEDGRFEGHVADNPSCDLRYPLLQPFLSSSGRKDSTGRFIDSKLIPWTTSPGAIVVQVIFQDFLNNLPGFDHVLGEVVVPLALLSRTKKIKGWFRVMDVGTSEVPVEIDSSVDEGKGLQTQDEHDSQQLPCIFLDISWEMHQLNPSRASTNEEISRFIQEELVRTSVLAKQNKFDLVGSSIGAVNTALGIGGNFQVVQDMLGLLLDSVEIAINLFNFTDPFKSSIVFVLIFVLWLILIIVPTRYILLLVGIVQYTVTFIEKYGDSFAWSVSKSGGNESKNGVKTEAESNIAIWVKNGLKSLPTAEDVRRTYFWECRRLGVQESEKFSSEKRASRLERLWKVEWFASVMLRVQGANDTKRKDDAIQWQPAFAVIHGHRFLWWDSVRNFDNGDLPIGHLFLSGHAGLTSPSPIEMRALPSDSISCLASLFGRGIGGQEKITILTRNPETREKLEGAVLKTSFKSD